MMDAAKKARIKIRLCTMYKQPDNGAMPKILNFFENPNNFMREE
jgi:hypothetical protein